jgi:predicted secreted protein
LKKIAVILLMLACFAMISGSFATNKNNGDMTSLKNVNHLTIILPSNPSTGYLWTAEYDNSKVKLLKKHYIPKIPVLCGSGGFDIFTFKGEIGASILMKHKSPSKLVVSKHLYHIK